jgi:Cu(I)/Ag(I) efflux system membrane fusion protein
MNQPVDQEHAAMPQSETQKEDAVYICPMNCVAPMEKPGRCPVCGMDLVAVAAQEHSYEEGPSRVTLSEETIKAAGIQVAPVERKIVTTEIRLFGKIEYDPVEQYQVTAFAPGIIDRIYIKRAGQTVRRGDPLFDMHSSELYFLEQELFEVLKHYPDTLDYRPTRSQRYKRLMRPARRTLQPPKDGKLSEKEEEALKAAQQKLQQIHRKMQLLGLSKTDIENVMARGQPSGISTVTTPTTGVVLEQYAYKGTYVNTGETIFTIANPKYIWAKLDAYESDVPWIRIGQEAKFETDSFPGETYHGKVLYLDPYFDQKTRTFKVGVLYTDPKTKLKPNMLVRCVIHAQMTAQGVRLPGRQAKVKAPLVIPESAPLVTGSRAVVYVKVANLPGAYEARQVILGARAKGYYVIKAGLEEGENVVVNGNFKIDSAVQILAQPSMMEHTGGQAMTMQHQHSETPAMEMKMEMAPKSDGPRKGQQHEMYRGHD